MTVEALLDRLRERGVQLELDGERLRVRAPRGSLDAALRASLQNSKEQLREHLGRPLPTPAMAALALHQALHPEDASYNVCLALRIEGGLDRQALAVAVDQLVDRHPPLRTCLRQQGEALLVLPCPGPPRLQERRCQDLDATLAELREQPFLLAAEAPFRAWLLRTERSELLLLVVHHVVFDGGSSQPLVDELGALYSARVEGRPPSLEPLPSSFATWTHEEAERRALPATAERTRRRLEHLVRHLPPAPLPQDRSPETSRVRGERVERRLDPGLARATRALARERELTLFVPLLAALTVVLTRWTGQPELAVATPLSRRDRPELRGLVGLLLETVPLLARVPPEASFEGLLRALDQEVLEALGHPEPGLAEAAAAVGLRPRVLFNLVGMALRPPRMAGLRVHLEESLPGARLDLAIYAYTAGEDITLAAAFDARRFEAARMDALLVQVERVLRQACEDPGLPVHSLRLRERSDPLPDPGLPLLARARPLALDFTRREALALRSETEDWDYARLAEEATGLAYGLAAEGLQAGQHVVINAARTPALVATLLAVWELGASFTLLDPGHPEDRNLACLRQLDARACVLLGQPHPSLEAALASVPRLHPGARRPRPPGPWTLPQDGPAYVAFTSGSTGLPRAIQGVHGPLANYIHWFVRRYDIGPDDRFAALAGLAHDPLFRDLFVALSVGASVHFPPDTPARMGPALAGWLAREGITVVHLTPALARHLAGGERTLPGLRRVLFGGDRLLPGDLDTWRRLAPNATLVNLYGATETPQGVAFHEPEDEDPVPVGAGIAGVQLLVEGSAGLAGVGELGEIVVRSAFLAQGYLRPQPGDGFEPGRFRTGDLGRYRADGSVVFAGRRDRRAKLRGHRVEPGEVEAALLACPGVRQAHVALQPQGLVAWVVGPAPEREALRRWLTEASLPTRIVALDAMPLTANGKLDSARLPVPDTPRPTGRAPATPTEQALARHWEALLGLEGLPATADFFALGGHSLMAARLAARLGQELGLELPLALFFEHRTVAAQALALAELSPVELPPPGPLGPDEPRRASQTQERMWLLERIGAPHQLRVSRVLRLRGPLDARALDAALVRIEERHDLLRTAFVWSSALPGLLLEPLPPRRSVLERVHGAGAQALYEHADFDVDEGYCWCARLAPSGPDEHLLLLSFHHLVADGGSLERVGEELRRCLAGEPLPPLPLDFADVAAWQRRRLEARPALEAWWRKRLEGLEPPDLPVRGPRPARPGQRSLLRRRSLDSLGQELDALRIQAGASAFMIVATALFAVLARATGQADLSLGLPTSRRPHPSAEPLVGLFVDRTVLRCSLAGDPRLAELLRRVRQDTLDTLDHAELPFERLVQLAEVERDGRRTPLYQVSLNELGLEDRAFALPGLAVEQVPRRQAPARTDLAFTLLQRDGAPELALVADAALFDEEQAEQWLEHLVCALQELCRRPSTRLSELPLRAPRPHAPRPLPRRPAFQPWAPEGSIESRFRAVVQAHGERPVLPDGLTYRELDAHAQAVAEALLDHQPPLQARRVALLFRKDRHLLAGLLGAARAGFTWVPLDPAHPPDRLAAIVDDAAVGALLTADQLGLPIALPELPLLRVDRLAPLPPRPLPAVPPERPAYLLYTSGSTGRPKGVVQSHRNLLHHLHTYTHRLGLDAEDRLSLLPSAAFDAGLMDLFGALFTGACLVPVSMNGEGLRELPRRVAGVSVLHATPTLFRHLCQQLESAGATPVEGVRLVVLGGEEALATDAALAERCFGTDCVLVNGLGPTECTLALQHVVEEPALRPSLPVGVPVGGLRARLLTPLGEQATLYGAGELVLEGEQVALGYWRRPELSARVFQQGPRAYRGGDRARWLPGGLLEFAGRADDQLKLRGHRVEPGEVAACLRDEEGVRQVVVLPRPDGAGLVAWVEADASLPEQALRARLRRLPRWMRPLLVRVESLPRGPTGKVDRAALARSPLPAAPPSRVARGEAERALVGLAERLLGLPLGPDEDFFEAGGHSLQAVQLVQEAERCLGRELSLARFFEHPTLADLARPTGPRHAPRPRLERLHPGPEPLLFVGVPGRSAREDFAPVAAALGLPAMALQPPDPEGGFRELATLCRRALDQPPRAICGWSLGGLLAWELATQLDRPLPLVLLDSPGPRPRPGPAIEAFSQHISGAGLRCPDLPSLHEQLRSSGRVHDLAALEALFDDYRARRERLHRAIAAWEPRPYEGPVFYLRASNPEGGSPAPVAAWATLARGGLQERGVSGDHLGLLQPPHAYSLSRTLDWCLGSAP